MSGGHWNYQQCHMCDQMLDIGSDGQLILAMPTLAAVIRELSEELRERLDELDYHFSGDTEIEDLAAWEAEATESMFDALSTQVTVTQTKRSKFE